VIGRAGAVGVGQAHVWQTARRATPPHVAWGAYEPAISSGGSGEGAEYAVAQHATAIEVTPQPADDLQSKVANGVLSYFLIEDHVLDPLPRFEQPAVLDLSVELTDGLLLLPVEVDSGDMSSVWSEDLPLRLRSRQAFLHKPHPTDRLASALAADVEKCDRPTCRPNAWPALHSAIGKVRVKSSTVRANEVTGTPSIIVTSSGSKGAPCTCTTLRLRPLPLRLRVTCTLSIAAGQTGRPCRTAAEP
jgi:hypothetical protein